MNYYYYYYYHSHRRQQWLLLLLLASVSLCLITRVHAFSVVPHRAHRHIFLVDDEPAIRHAVGELLMERGYHVTTFEDGKDIAEAMALDSSASPSMLLPDCIVSDIRMVHMDGMELLSKLRRSSTAAAAAIPVVLLTAKRRTEDRIIGYQTGADAYLPKPFDPEELVAIIESCIAHRENVDGRKKKKTTKSIQDESMTIGNENDQYDNEDEDENDEIVLIDELQRDVEELKHLFLRQHQQQKEHQQQIIFLAPDEQTILELVCDGLQTREIADRMYLSKRRIEQLLTRIFRKTECKNRTDLVRWAISTGNVRV